MADSEEEGDGGPLENQLVEGQPSLKELTMKILNMKYEIYRVRKIVREEIAKISNSQSNAQNIYARAQGLIRNAASAYTAEIAELRTQGSQQ